MAAGFFTRDDHRAAFAIGFVAAGVVRMDVGVDEETQWSFRKVVEYFQLSIRAFQIEFGVNHQCAFGASEDHTVGAPTAGGAAAASSDCAWIVESAHTNSSNFVCIVSPFFANVGTWSTA
jgi:hypothetical protein